MNRWTSWGVFAGAALLAAVGGVAACGGTVVDSATGGAGGAGGAGSGGTPFSTGDVVGQGGCAGEDCSGPGGSTGSGGGLICGGLVGAACPDDAYYCEYPPASSCGGDDGTGLCKLRPESCGKNLDPVCGCDGKIYDNACIAEKAGVSPTDSTACMFACGDAFCQHLTEYCQLTVDAHGNVDEAVCLPLEAECNGTPSCDCLHCQSCEQSTSGDVVLTCGEEIAN